ncbi:MAG: RNA methyltransferase [Chloroflexi bacterium]|nr:RNA methyltransferase [Chloroflexota bacterium]
MITSSSNSKIKHVRALSRRKERHAARQFVVEGVRLVEEAVQAKIIPAFVLHTSSVEDDQRAQALLEELRAVTQVLAVSDAVMKEISNTETPQGVLAVVPFIELALPTPPQFVLILDAVRDPGNVGTIMRSARAAGVDELLFAPGTADPYNDKVVRSAMGAHFFVPFRALSRWREITEMTKMMPRIYLADAHGDVDYAHADWSRPVALIVGGEAEGASDTAHSAKIAAVRVSIPMLGGTESLNAAMAATVLLFQAARA